MTELAPADRRRWQLRLRTMILLVVLAALGLNIARDRRQITRLEREFARLSPLSSKPLVVTDPSQVATQVIWSMRNDDQRWEVYLPPGGRYRLCLGTRLGANNDPPPSYRTAPIEPGRHILSFDVQPIGPQWRVFATWNQADRLMADETSGWYDPTGWSGYEYGQRKLPLGERVPLTYRIYGAGRSGRGSRQASGAVPEVAGLEFWIETEPISSTEKAPPGR